MRAGARRNHSEKACERLFEHFFVDADSLVARFAPDGWENSPLLFIFHPTPQQRYREALRFHKNLESLFGKSGRKRKSEPPKLSDFSDSEPDETDPSREIVEILGMCLWDIFSDNHEVMSTDGMIYDIGSFRGAAGFIAGYINSHFTAIERRYDYLDFYMGSIWVCDRADLLAIYTWIFEQLRRLDCDWKYSFPRIGLIDFGKPKKQNDDEGADMLAYDPGKAVEDEIAHQKREQEIARLREELDRIYEQELEEAKDKPPPKTVQAYKIVYGCLPDGWPHW